MTNFDKDEGKLVRKKSIHIHPHFLSDASWDMSVNDIALIQLEKHLEFGPHVHPVGITFQVKKISIFTIKKRTMFTLLVLIAFM